MALTTPQTANVYNVYRFDIKAEIFDKVLVSLSQTNTDEIADSYQYDGEYPQKFDPINTNENGYLHGQVQAQFKGDADMQDQPQAVFITLQKENQVAYSVHADYIPEIQRYQVFANLNNLLTHKINGEYTMTPHIEDPRMESYSKTLG